MSNNHGMRKIPSIGVQHTITQFTSGPLPPPEAFQRYDTILPGAAERMLVMAEKHHEIRLQLEVEESASARKMDEHDTIEANSQMKRGQWFAFIITLFSISGGMWLLSMDKPVTGVSTILGALVVLGGTFIGSYRSTKKTQQ
jgi:uncharacterized membrane protein